MTKLLILSMLLLSLSFNVAVLISETIFTLASSAFTALTDIPTTASKIHPKNTKVKFKGKKVTVAEAVGSTTRGIKRRAVKTATKSVGAMAFEAAPFVGPAIIVSVTAWELKDLCDTAKDMDALNKALNPDEVANTDEISVCAISVPSTEELKTAVSEQTEESIEQFKSLLSELRE
ncbi:hypothetical protein N9M08_07910 [Porticoccaceae bacterium]|nr:hypothetical protein [Porticoccaceae bacterium]MDB2486496.1 hypothetical protein [Porticoccaceae bacterium]MDB2635454.1 hypothetical protein [Porticoccaceae bacterium]